MRFAFGGCEDALGRYYNSYWSLLNQPLDFVAFIGDYIYETSGDPSFQNTPGRGLTFTDTAGAIRRGSGAGTFYAAASMSNYRELYRFYRSDPVLQSVYERFPFVHIWDDHEYSDDCWGATATYTNGLRNEFNVQRRRNAEHVFFEYIGIDDGSLAGGALDPAAKPVYPDARIYRDFRFGANLHLLLTDYRSFRPDHLISEDAFPGTVAVDRGALTLLLGASGAPYDAVKASFSPYIDLAFCMRAEKPGTAGFTCVREFLRRGLFINSAGASRKRSSGSSIASTWNTYRGCPNWPPSCCAMC